MTKCGTQDAFLHKFQHLLMYYFRNKSPHSVPIIKRVIKRKYINHLSFKIFRCKPWNICSFMVWLAVAKQKLFMKLLLFCFYFILMCTCMYVYLNIYFCSKLFFHKKTCKGPLYWVFKAQNKRRKRYLSTETSPTEKAQWLNLFEC